MIRRLVVADDDPIMRDTICAVLQSQWPGAEILAASDGHEAIRAIKKASGPVDVLVLDIFMPGKDGLETLTAVRREAPDTVTVVVTGGSQTSLRDAPVREMALLLGASSVLGKPFTAEQLSSAVRAATEPVCV